MVTRNDGRPVFKTGCCCSIDKNLKERHKLQEQLMTERAEYSELERWANEGFLSDKSVERMATLKRHMLDTQFQINKTF